MKYFLSFMKVGRPKIGNFMLLFCRVRLKNARAARLLLVIVLHVRHALWNILGRTLKNNYNNSVKIVK